MSVSCRPFRSLLLAGTALTLVWISLPHIASAATDTFTGATNNNFNLGGNYDTGNAPGTNDTGVFGNAGAAQTNVVLSSNSTIAALAFTGSTSYSFNIGSGISFDPGQITTTSTANQIFNVTGTGSFTVGPVVTNNTTLTFTGNAPTISGFYNSTGGTLDFSQTTGTVNIGSISDTSGAGGIILGSGNLSLNESNVGGTYEGIISGAGGLTLAALSSGVLNLVGNNTYTGGTTIEANNSLTASTSSLPSAGGVDIAQNGDLSFENSTAGTYSGVISGSGSLFVFANTTITLSGANTFSGSTSIGGATLSVGQGNTDLGSSVTFLGGGSAIQTTAGISTPNTVTLTGNGTINTDGNSDTFSGAFGGAGGLTVASSTGNGTLNLTNTGNNYTGGTTINSGATLNVTTASLPASNGVAANGTLQFADSGAGTYSGVISGAGNVQIIGGGTVTLSGANTFTGTTTINNASTLSVDQGNADLGNVLVFGAGGGTLQTTPTMSGVAFFSNNIVLNGNGTIDIDGGSDQVFGDVSGAGGLNIISSGGGGELALNGTNTYTGGTTIGSGASMVTSGLHGAGSIDIAQNGELLLENSTPTTYSGIISGSGDLFFGNSATITLSGANTFSGTTGIAFGATLSVGQGNTDLGSSILFLGGGGTLQTTAGISTANTVSLSSNGTIDTDGNSDIFSGQFTGSGGLTVASSTGNGTLNLTNTGNNYTGGTTINSGATLNVTTASLPASNGVAANGTLQFSDSGAGTYSGVISGAGNVQIIGGGTVTLSGANTFTGTTTINNASTLSVGSGNNDLGNAVVFGTGGGAIQTTAAISTAIGLTLNGAGAINTAGNNDTVSGAVTGAGGLTKTGAGTLTLSSTNNYSGGTTIAGGTLALGANDAAGTGSVLVDSGAIFALGNFNQTVTNITGAGSVTATGGTLTADAGGYTGTITSAGTLSKVTTGNLLFNGSGSFTSTTVSNGTLEVGDISNPAATLTSPVTVANGGTLMGHGTIIGALANSGTVQPGGTIGTLSVNGNYTQASNGTLAIELNPTVSSRLAVTGSAMLGGGLLLLPDGGTYASGTQYTIVSAGGGVTGAFATVTENGVVPYTLTYLPNAVDLTIGGGSVGPTSPDRVFFHVASLTPNEANATNAIESILSSGSATGAFAQGLVSLAVSPANSGTRTQLAGVLGEARADLATIDLANLTSFQNFLVERMDQRQGLTTSRTANSGLPGTFDVAMNDSDLPLFVPSQNSLFNKQQPSLWIHGYGVFGEAGGEPGFADFQYRTGGVVGGIDGLINPGTLLGGAVAYEHTDLNLSGDNAQNYIDTYRVSLYGSQKLNPVPLVLDAAFGYAFNDYHNSDFVPFASGTGFSQTSRHDGNELTADSGLSHAFTVPQNFTTGTLILVPRAGVEYDNIQQTPYTATGAPATGLNFATNGSTLNALRSTIGARADLKLTTDHGTMITPELRASYLHDFMDTNVGLTQAFTGAPTAGFTVSGVHPGRDAALVGTSISVGFTQDISMTLSYDADIRNRELDNVVQAGAKYTW